MKNIPKKFVWFICLMPTLLGFDFWTKEVVNARILPGEEVTVFQGLLSFVHAENPFVAFSMPVPMWMSVSFAIVATVILTHMLWNLPNQARLPAISIALMTAGALGNLVDRLMDGSVTDFIRVYTDHPSLAPQLIETFGTATWPIFNIADMALFFGVVLFMIGSMFDPKEVELTVPADVKQT